VGIIAHPIHNLRRKHQPRRHDKADNDAGLSKLLKDTQKQLAAAEKAMQAKVADEQTLEAKLGLLQVIEYIYSGEGCVCVHRHMCLLLREGSEGMCEGMHMTRAHVHLNIHTLILPDHACAHISTHNLQAGARDGGGI